jgi:hypothetical protein
LRQEVRSPTRLRLQAETTWIWSTPSNISSIGKSKKRPRASASGSEDVVRARLDRVDRLAVDAERLRSSA